MAREIAADRVGRDSDAWCPFSNKVLNVRHAVIARVKKILRHLMRAQLRRLDCFWPNPPNRRNPGHTGMLLPDVPKIQVRKPLASTGQPCILILERKQRRIANQDSRIAFVQHGVKIRRKREKFWIRAMKFAE